MVPQGQGDLLLRRPSEDQQQPAGELRGGGMATTDAPSFSLLSESASASQQQQQQDSQDDSGADSGSKSAVHARLKKGRMAQYTGLSIRVNFNGPADEGMMLQQLSGGQKTLVRRGP